MVGLKIVLESQKGCGGGGSINQKHPQVINKTTMNVMSTRKSLNPSTLNSPPCTTSWFPCMGSSFLEQCFLCAQKLLAGRDIYMYKGDRAFCSEECRWKQICMDEEDTLKKGKNNCSLAAYSSSRSSSGASCCPKATRNQVGAFAH